MPDLWKTPPAERQLATDVRVTSSILGRLLGVIPDQPLDDDYGLVMQYDAVKKRPVHMLGVREPLDVLWLDGQRVVEVQQLAPWRGHHHAFADTVVELPAETATGITPGACLELRSTDPLPTHRP